MALALVLLPWTVLGTVAPETLNGVPPTETSKALLMLLTALVGLIARVATARIALGPSATLSSALAASAKRSLPVLGALLLFMIPVVLLLTPVLPLVIASPQTAPAEASLAVLVITIIAFVLGVRLVSLLIPVAAAETLGPIGLLKRSWKLTRGNWWRLAALIVLFFIGATIAIRAVSYAVGAILLISSGQIEAMTLSALLLSIAVATMNTIFVVLLWLMLARVYAQLAGQDAAEAETSVPSSGG